MSRLQELLEELCPNGVEYKELQEVLKIRNGRDYKTLGSGKYPVYGSGGVMTYVDSFAYDKPSVLIPRKGSIDKLYYVDEPFWNVDTVFYTEINEQLVLPRYLFHVLLREHLEKLNTAGGVPSLTQSVLNRVKLPVPPLEVQCEIVRVLDSFTLLTDELTDELTARKKQYEYYFRKIMNMYESPIVKLGDIGQVKMCKRILKSQTSSTGEIPFYKIGTFGKEADAFMEKEVYDEYIEKYSHPNKGDILISCSGTIGRTVVYDGKPAYFQDSNIVWLQHDGTKVSNEYLYYVYQTKPWIISTGGTISRLYNDGILKAEIPLPTLEEQEKIVKMLSQFEMICNDISSGLPAEIEARKKQYEYYRDKLLSFKELEKVE